jgi:hypothetical protein
MCKKLNKSEILVLFPELQCLDIPEAGFESQEQFIRIRAEHTKKTIQEQKIL